jgi:IS5 family transposase
MSFDTFVLREAYRRYQKLGDKLTDAGKLIDWKAFVPIIAGLFSNNTPLGGRPNYDGILMLKMLVLQQWHGLSDQELERQVTDRLSFLSFLGFPERIPDYTTVWLFRERLIKSGKMEKVWRELQRQLESKGMDPKKIVAQDSTFITADPGHASMEEQRGNTAMTRRSKDGTWAMKLKKSYFGFKLHVKTDLSHGLIRAFRTTTASVHDSQVDLSRRGEVVYRDKGYFGVPAKGHDATMQRGTRAGPIGIWDRLRNARISRRRAPIERTFSVLKRTFRAGHVMVTTVPRVKVKMLFSCLCFNLMQMLTLEKKRQASV